MVDAERLRGRRILVTGAAGGQGSEVARRLAGEGAVLAITDVEGDAFRLLEKDLRNVTDVFAIPADLRDQDSVQRVCEGVLNTLGGLDGLYNNAGVYLHDLDAPVDRLELSTWDRVMSINPTRVSLFCKYLIPALCASEKGVVINVSSTAGISGDQSCHAYAASKGALIALTLSIAQHYGPLGVRAVVLCPGFIETPMVDFVTADVATAEQVRSASALRRLGSPDEIAAVAAFLLSDDASFITSTVISAHGGLIK